MVAALRLFGVHVRGTYDYDVCRCGFTFRCALYSRDDCCCCLACSPCAGRGALLEGVGGVRCCLYQACACA